MSQHSEKGNFHIIHIHYNKEKASLNWESKLKLNDLKKYCLDKFKLKKHIEQLSICAYYQKKYYYVENDNNLNQLIFEKNADTFILNLKEVDYIGIINDLEKKYNILEEKYNNLINIIKEQDNKIKQLFSFIQSQKKVEEDNFFLFSQSTILILPILSRSSKEDETSTSSGNSVDIWTGPSDLSEI